MHEGTPQWSPSLDPSATTASKFFESLWNSVRSLDLHLTYLFLVKKAFYSVIREFIGSAVRKRDILRKEIAFVRAASPMLFVLDIADIALEQRSIEQWGSSASFLEKEGSS